mgnify:CR=1 FL=1
MPAPEIAAPEPVAQEIAVPAPPAGPTLPDLLDAAEAHGLNRANLLTAARHYCGADHLEDLTRAEIADLLGRLEARYGSAEGSPAEPAPKPRTNGRAKLRSAA